MNYKSLLKNKIKFIAIFSLIFVFGNVIVFGNFGENNNGKLTQCDMKSISNEHLVLSNLLLSSSGNKKEIPHCGK